MSVSFFNILRLIFIFSRIREMTLMFTKISNLLNKYSIIFFKYIQDFVFKYFLIRFSLQRSSSWNDLTCSFSRQQKHRMCSNSIKCFSSFICWLSLLKQLYLKTTYWINDALCDFDASLRNRESLSWMFDLIKNLWWSHQFFKAFV